jgi:predicted transglutaminase-like cysteine proteinase
LGQWAAEVMRGFGYASLLACMVVVSSVTANAESAHPPAPSLLAPQQRTSLPETLHSSWAAVGPVTSVPSGWIDLCERYIGECDTPRLAPVDVDLTPAGYDVLDRVNRWVNETIEPMRAIDHWGVINQWDYPVDGKGDCNSYALLKRKILLEKGFPRQALLMTVVRDLNGDGHMILTVKTNKGDLILDNLVDEVRVWNDTGYRFIKRQTQEDPNVWVAVGDAAPQVETRLR